MIGNPTQYSLVCYECVVRRWVCVGSR